MKKLIALLMAGCVTLGVLAGCSGDFDPDKSGLDLIREKGEIVMYTNAEFPPFEYMGSDLVPVGVDIEIAEEIAEEIGVELKVENVAFDAVIESVKSGKGDFGAAGITINEERKEEVDFSIEYTTSIQYIIVPEDTDVNTIEDLAGMTIGVQQGTTGDFIISDEVNGYKDDDGNEVQGVLQGTGASVTPMKNAPLAVQDLVSGRLDAVVIDKLPAEILTSLNSGLKCLEAVYENGGNTDESYGICVAKGNEELLEVINTVLQRKMDDGSIEELIVKHSNDAAE